MTGLISLILLALFVDTAVSDSSVNTQQLDRMEKILQDMNERVKYLEFKKTRDEVPLISRLFEKLVSDEADVNKMLHKDVGKYLKPNPISDILDTMVTDPAEPSSEKSHDTPFHDVHRVRRRRQANTVQAQLNELIERVINAINTTWENANDVALFLNKVIQTNRNFHTDLHAIHEDLKQISVLLRYSNTQSLYGIDSASTVTIPQVKLNEIQIPSTSVVRSRIIPSNSCKYTSCVDLKRTNTTNGIYQICVRDSVLNVYCDQITDKGGWIVIQRRIDGTVNFTRNWQAYRNGFGQMNREFWLGNENLCVLTSTGPCELRIDMVKLDGSFIYAKYNRFQLLPEAQMYQLNVSGYSGNAGDDLSYHNDMKFSTLDADNDMNQYGNCGEVWKGGWWYNGCYRVHLNGVYSNQLSVSNDMEQMRWGRNILQKVTMKLRCQ